MTDISAWVSLVASRELAGGWQTVRGCLLYRRGKLVGGSSENPDNLD